jgi:hypothetical protein
VARLSTKTTGCSWVKGIPSPMSTSAPSGKLIMKLPCPLIEKGAPIIIVMPGAVYGPGDPSLVGDLMRAYTNGLLPIFPGPETQITLAHVEDVAEGHLLAAEKGRIGESYLLTGPGLNFKEMAEMWAKTSGRSAPLAYVPAAYIRPLASLVGKPKKSSPYLRCSARTASISWESLYWAAQKKRAGIWAGRRARLRWVCGKRSSILRAPARHPCRSLLARRRPLGWQLQLRHYFCSGAGTGAERRARSVNGP